jgi:putative ABC transport system permease protein
VAPLAALRDVAVDRSGTSVRRAVLGVVITVAGLVAVLTATSSPDRALLQSGAGALVVIVGAVVLGPVAARPAASVLGGAIAATRGVSGTLARRNALRNPRRVAGSASALMVGTAVVALFATFGASIKESIDQEVGRAFSGDLVVLQTDWSGAGISPEARPAIAALAEVDSVVGVSFVAASVEGAEFNPVATDPAALAQAFDLGVTDGDLAAMTGGDVAVSTSYAAGRDLDVGDPLTVEFVDGSVEMRIAAIYEETLSFGDVVITNDDWTPRARGLGEGVLFVNLTDGTTITDGQRAVATITERFGAPDPQTRDEYIDATGAQVDQMMAIVYGLLGVAVLIALLGIANTLSLSIHERTRELGLLRAVGQTRRQVRATVRWESVIVAIFGTIGGVGLGTFLGWGLMRALRAQEGLGAFAAPTTTLVVILVLAALAGVLAAVRPARRAARLDVLAAISTD